MKLEFVLHDNAASALIDGKPGTVFRAVDDEPKACYLRFNGFRIEPGKLTLLRGGEPVASMDLPIMGPGESLEVGGELQLAIRMTL